MPHHGAPQIIVKEGEAAGMRVAVISSLWNQEITDQLHERAVQEAVRAGASVSQWRVAGALELAVVVARAAQNFDAVVATGCVIEGETEHFRIVCDAVTYALTRIPLDTGVPVGNGVLTVANQQQAVARAGGADASEDKGTDAARAAIHTALLIRRDF